MSKKANITVIGFPKILSSCQEVAEEYFSNAHFLYYQYIPEISGVKYISSSPDHPLGNRAKSFKRVNHDIIIVGVVTAKVMEGINENNVIPFRAGHKALIKAFIKAKHIADRAAFICPIEEKHDVSFYENLLGISIDIYYAEHLSDYRRFCVDAKQKGHSVVISGSYTFQIAKDYGLKPVFLFSDHDIFHDAYTRALETHRYNQSLEEKVAQLEIISQNSEDSVIFVNRNNHITFTNKVAEQKLQLHPGRISGKHVANVFSFISADMLDQKKNSEIIGSMNREPILVTIHPVFVGPNAVGNVLMAKKVNEIRAMDSRIRQKMRHKGFTAKYTFEDILGDSPTLQQCKKDAELYAASEAPVLIYGATGTGKELFAQAIHNSSPRKRFPFVAINCATLPAELMESELFGYVKGAFTGASSAGKQGLVDQAHLGTLFFDEVDSLSTSLQAKLLRLLQEKEFIRVGGDEVIPVDIRIIAACNKKQSEDQQKNLLRQDLFYRLSTLYLALPDLLERKSDIPLLFRHFLEEYDRALAEMIFPLPDKVISLLSGLSFQGNLRELQSIVTRFACLCDKSELNNQDYLFELIQSCCHAPVMQAETETHAHAGLVTFNGTLAESVKETEKALLYQAQENCGGSIQLMAKQLGVGRTTLWRKLKEHNIS
ncbi:MAG: sigma 54-interacting transcriptional regulator [Desulfobacterales bacterium]|nr:sigma 54-interacting transcriptional regulator [Desulfobacterales bacterium]